MSNQLILPGLDVSREFENCPQVGIQVAPFHAEHQ